MWGRRGILKARGCSNDGSICRLFSRCEAEVGRSGLRSRTRARGRERMRGKQYRVHHATIARLI